MVGAGVARGGAFGRSRAVKPSLHHVLDSALPRGSFFFHFARLGPRLTQIKNMRILTLSPLFYPQTTVTPVNMGLPPALLPSVAPPPARRAPCAVTGGAAPYRDPRTGAPFADAAAFAQLKAGSGAGWGVGRPPPVTVAPAAEGEWGVEKRRRETQTGAALVYGRADFSFSNPRGIFFDVFRMAGRHSTTRCSALSAAGRCFSTSGVWERLEPRLIPRLESWDDTLFLPLSSFSPPHPTHTDPYTDPLLPSLDGAPLPSLDGSRPWTPSSAPPSKGRRTALAASRAWAGLAAEARPASGGRRT